MQKFILKIFIFSIPFFLWILVISCIDPFNYYGEKPIIFSKDIKYSTAYQINSRLFKLIQFSKKPEKNIVLGDSRAYALDYQIMSEISGKQFINLAYGGSSFKEIIATFWYIVKKNEIEEVYIGLSLYNMNSNQDDARVQEAIKIMSNFVHYSFNIQIYRTMKEYTKYLISGKKLELGKYKHTKEEIWAQQLESASNFYKRFQIYINYYDELKKMSDYCRDNNIKLVFFIPPTHIELQNLLSEYRLVILNGEFKKNLREFGLLHDFSISKEIIYNKNNFSDPFHFTENVSESIIKNLLLGKR